MPRREQPLESSDEVLLRFAGDLRELRERAGRPTYRQLSARAHYSPAALSEAAGGRKLPTLAVTLAYVKACGGDPAAWEARWRAAAAELAAGDEKPGGGSGRAPYVGTAIFEVADADRFRGRDRSLEQVCTQLRDHRIVALFGASGSGKSSFLRAGLVTELTRNGIPVLLFTPGSDPIEECAIQLACHTGRSPAELRADLAADPANLHLHLRQALAGRPGTELTVIVDQFEDALATEARDWLCAALTAAATGPTSRTRVVVGVRSDFRDRCVRLLAAHPVTLEPMSPDELRQAITEPAVRAGYRVETALVSELIAVSAHQPGALALVQRALLDTWHRRKGATLTLAGYQATGGVAATLARTAEDVYAELDERQRPVARQIFLRLTELGDAAGDTGRRVARPELDTGDPEVPAVLDRLARARIVTLDRNTVELAHDSLPRTWPRLMAWLREDRATLRTQRELSKATTTWESWGRDPDALYRGPRLDQARQLPALTAREREFLEASLSARRREVRRTRRLIALFVGVVLAAATAISAAVIAKQEASETALAEQAMREASALRVSNPALAVQLSLAAYRLHPSPETRGNLYDVMAMPYAARITGVPNGVTDLDVNRTGSQLAITGPSGTTLLSINDPSNPHVLGRIPGGATSVRFSPDGLFLAVGGQLWDIRLAGQPKQSGRLGDRPVTSVAFGPDGLLATISTNWTIQLWNVAHPDHPAPLGAPFGGAEPGTPVGTASVAFAAGGGLLITTTPDYRVQVWKVANPGQHWLLDAKNVVAMAVSHSGDLVATVSEDMTAAVWDPWHPRSARTTVYGLEGTGRSVAFSQDDDEDILAIAGKDGTTRLYDLKTQHLFATLPGHTGEVRTVAFAPDRRTLVTGSADETVRLTDIGRLQLSRSVGPLRDVAFGPRGSSIAAAGDDHRVHLWSLADRTLPVPRPAQSFQGGIVLADEGEIVLMDRANEQHVLAVSPKRQLLVTDTSLMAMRGADPPLSLATLDRPAVTAVFSPDGRLLATTDSAGQLWLWDVSDPSRPHTKGSAPDAGVPVAFSGAGLLAVVGADGTTRLWDVTRPEQAQQVSLVASGILGTQQTRVAFSADGRRLATAGDTATQLWDITDPHQPRLQATIRGEALAVTFSGDGTLFATAGDDHAVRLWDTDVEKVAARICDVAHPRMTSAEWHRYLPAVTYRPPCPTE